MPTSHESPQSIELKATTEDLSTSGLAAALSMVPVVGPLLSTALSKVIPRQRVDRIAKFAELLQNRIATLEATVVELKMMEPEMIDLVEDASWLATRALDESRLHMLAAVLSSEFEADEPNYAETKQVLRLLKELTNAEVIILGSHSRENHSGRNPDYWERHKGILAPRSAALGQSQEDIDEATIWKEQRKQLVRLGLLSHRYKKPKTGEVPDLDPKTGMMKSSGYELTGIGRILLRRIDVAGEGE